MKFSPEALSEIRSYLDREHVAEAVRIVVGRGVEVLSHRARNDSDIFACEVDAYPETLTVTMNVDVAGDIRFNCNCGTSSPCEHLGAVHLTVYDLIGTPESQPHSAWRRDLDNVLLADGHAAADTEICLFVTSKMPVGGGYGNRHALNPTLAMRPGIKGARDKWIKGQAKWEALSRLDIDPAARDAMVALDRTLSGSYASYSWARPDEWVRLESAPSLDLWHGLMRVYEAGVPIVSFGASQLPVRLSSEKIEVVGTLHADDEMVVLGAEARLGGAPVEDSRFWPLGNPTAVFAEVDRPGERDERVTLYELAERLSNTSAQLLRRAEPLIVPRAELTDFEQHYLPQLMGRLRLESPDQSYRVPEPPRNTLRLDVVHGEQQTHLAWQWLRPAGLPDPGWERGVLSALREAGGDLRRLLWPDGGGAGAGNAGAGSAAETDALPVAATLGAAATARFTAELLPRLREVDGLEVVENGAAREYRAAEASPIISVRSENEGDWFDLHFTITIEGEPVEFSDLFTALVLGDPVFVLPSGTYFPLDGPEFIRLREIVEEARALTDQPSSGVRLDRHQVDLWDELTELGVVAAQEAQWWLSVRSLGETAEVTAVAPPVGLQARLRDYQAQGLSWLHFLRTHGLGGILADDMGLGKTLQAIAMMELARQEEGDGVRFLVVAPTSVVGNWASECARFAPGLKAVVINSMEGRRGASLAEAIEGANVVITSYALFRGEADAYQQLDWSGLILDEAQQIKNQSSRGYRAARMLGAPFTLVITGTPIENNLLELWALCSLATPGLLGTKQRFTDYFRGPIEKEKNADRLAVLQRRLRPFLLRRTKDLVATELPSKQEQVLEIELHPKHRKLYDVRFQRERQRLLGLIEDTQANSFKIFQSLTLLRQLALDPSLVGAGDAPSAKLDAFVELLSDAAAEGHRVLVLSQFTRFLTSARDRAAAAGLASQYLDGSTTDRQAVIDEFRGGTDPAFFVSLKAGGFGLNLVEADYVVLLDPWWNPAVEAQAIDRTHRIGQTKPVFVYRLVAANTIEQKVIALREAKAELFRRVLDGSGGGGSGTISAAEIRELLE